MKLIQQHEYTFFSNTKFKFKGIRMIMNYIIIYLQLVIKLFNWLCNYYIFTISYLYHYLFISITN